MTKTLVRLSLYGPYYKCKLEMKSNSSEILPVTCRFICMCSYLSFLRWKLDLKDLKFEFVSLSWNRITGKLAINWQNFARVQLQLKFAFIIRAYVSYFQNHGRIRLCGALSTKLFCTNMSWNIVEIWYYLFKKKVFTFYGRLLDADPSRNGVWARAHWAPNYWILGKRKLCCR